MALEGPNGIQLFYAISMAILANTILPSVADRPVVDKTGLTGYYDIALPSSAFCDRCCRLLLQGCRSRLDAPSPLLQDESIFAALEALGLRLNPLAKGQVRTLVIDHVERPSDN